MDEKTKKFLTTDVGALFKIIGQHLKRHNTLLVVILSIILLSNIAITLGWYYSPDEVPQITETTFYVAQGVLFLATLAAIVFLFLIRLGKFNELFLAIADHVYAVFLIAWATIAFCFDLSLGFSPLIYLIVVTFVAGIFVVDPFFFLVIEILSLVPISITIINNPELFFGGEYLGENIALFVIFVVLIIIICFRNYQIIYMDYRIQKKLHNLSYNDELTGLMNERSYIDVVEEIDRKIDKGEDVKFAVILMDVNNLKATNDAFGHRYGCSLVVRCGHTLPTLLHTSKLFHIGGDEFIAIVMGDDLVNFEETMKKFDEAMLYSLVEYEGQTLIFSVARGYHIRESGQHYKDVLQIADKAMYENKKYLKEKYNMKGR